MADPRIPRGVQCFPGRTSKGKLEPNAERIDDGRPKLAQAIALSALLRGEAGLGTVEPSCVALPWSVLGRLVRSRGRLSSNALCWPSRFPAERLWSIVT